MEQLKSKEFFTMARFNKLPVIAKQDGANGYALFLEQTIDDETTVVQMVTMVDGTENVLDEKGLPRVAVNANGEKRVEPDGKTPIYVKKKVLGARYFGNLSSIEKVLKEEKIKSLQVQFDDVEIISSRAGKEMPESTKQALATARAKKNS